MKILLFGKLGDTMGREIVIDGVGGRTVADLRQSLAERYPAASADLLSPRVRACANDVLVGDGHIIRADDEVALLPPVSGG